MNELYLVTGGAGFIGSNIVETLLKENKRVRVIDNFSTGRNENLSFVKDITLDNEQFELIKGDIRDINTCNTAIEGVDYVLHQAALPSVMRSVENPVETNEVNINGTLNLLWASKNAKVKRLVCASSSSVYGDSPSLPKKVDMKPSPLSPYAVSKLTGEYYCSNFFKLYGLETVSLRYFNVFGPRQDPTSHYSAVIPKFVNALMEGEKPVIYGDGEQSRDFTFIRNVVEANLLALRTPNLSSRVFNIACGVRTSINELFQKIKNIEGSDLSPVYKEKRPGDVRDSLADIEPTRRELGYSPGYSLDDGLKETVEWFKNNRI